MAFLRQLKRHLPGPWVLLWDRSKIHSRALAVRAWLAKHPEVVVEDFPGYAPELNPDEMVWGHTKYHRLANFAPADIWELRVRLIGELVELQSENARKQAESEAVAAGILLEPYKTVDSKLMLALAFRDFAANADKIGNLNISSELLERLLSEH